MARAFIIIASEQLRQRAMSLVSKAPIGYRVEMKEPRRTIDQNDALWAYLTDISLQVEHQGRKYDTDTWKAIFMNALGAEMRFVPTLDGSTVFPLGMRSSKLSKKDMSALIDFIIAEGVKRGVVFHDTKEMAA